MNCKIRWFAEQLYIQQLSLQENKRKNWRRKKIQAILVFSRLKCAPVGWIRSKFNKTLLLARLWDDANTHTYVVFLWTFIRTKWRDFHLETNVCIRMWCVSGKNIFNKNELQFWKKNPMYGNRIEDFIKFRFKSVLLNVQDFFFSISRKNFCIIPLRMHGSLNLKLNEHSCVLFDVIPLSLSWNGKVPLWISAN